VDAAHRRRHHLIAQMEVAGHAHFAAKDDIAAQSGTAGNADLRHENRIFADHNIMAHHYQIIDAGSGLDPGRAEGGPVDAGIGADFDVVVDLHRADLRFLVMDAHPVGGKAEAVAADHRPMVEDDPPADGAAVGHGHVGMDDGIVADHGVAADHRAGMDGHPFTENNPVAEADQRTDGHRLRQGTALPHHCRGMNASGLKGFGQEKGMDAGGGHRRLFGNKHREWRGFDAGRHDAGRSPALCQQAAVACYRG
jgi:hypothetical protein